MAKYEYGTCHKGSFCRGSNIDLYIIMCKDNIFIWLIIQRYVLHCYHPYIPHTGMDRTEAILCQNFYWPGIKAAVRKEVKNCDTFQCKKRSNIKYGKLPCKKADNL